MKAKSHVAREEVKMRVYVHGENGSGTYFKISIDKFSVKIKSKPIDIEDNIPASLTLENFLAALITQSDWIKGIVALYKSISYPEAPSLYITDNGKYGYTILSEEDSDSSTLVRKISEFHFTDMLHVGKKISIKRNTFNAMLVVIYSKLENEKAPIDTDDDIEDYDNYFKAYSNTKFTDASLKKILEMSGNDHSNED